MAARCLSRSRPTNSDGLKSSGLHAGCLFFHRDGDRTGGGEAHLVAFDAGNQATVDIVVVALGRSLAAALLRELEPVALELVDRADVDAVGADDFHVLLDTDHDLSLL